jgi:hypothetical protein
LAAAVRLCRALLSSLKDASAARVFGLIMPLVVIGAIMFRGKTA